MRQPNRNFAPGSAVVMAIGLLVILAMLGTAFVIITQVDRREAVSLATAAPVRSVVADVLEQVRTQIENDVYAGPFGRYSTSPSHPIITATDLIDAPGSGVDPWLAQTEPDLNANNTFNQWRHISYIGNPVSGLVDTINFASLGAQVYPINPATGLQDTTRPPLYDQYVDADGDGLKDSIVFATGVRDANGREYFAAVRVIDTSGLVNLNVATSPLDMSSVPPVATNSDDDRSGQVITPSNISLKKLFSSLNSGANNATLNIATRAIRMSRSYGSAPNPQTIQPSNIPGFDSLQDEFAYYARYGLSPDSPGTLYDNNIVKPNAYYLPFDHSDALALADASGKYWLASRLMNTVLNAAGQQPLLYRAYSTNGTNSFPLAPAFGTAKSSSSIAVPSRWVNWNLAYTRQCVKADLNRAGFNELYAAFYNFFAGDSGIPVGNRSLLAAQMAVNVIDFRDVDDTPTAAEVPGMPGTFVYGYERQPFITEIAYELQNHMADLNNSEVTEQYGLELFNPYASSIDMSGWTIRCGTMTYGPIPAGTVVIPPGGRWFFTSGQGAGTTTWDTAWRLLPANPVATPHCTTNGSFNLKGTKPPPPPPPAPAPPPPDLVITRPSTITGQEAIVARVRHEDLFPNDITPDDCVKNWINPGNNWPGPADNLNRDLRRWDDPQRCLYALDVARDYPANPLTPRWGLEKSPPLPSANNEPGLEGAYATIPSAIPPNTLPIPLYVRNGPFETIADLDHVLCCPKLVSYNDGSISEYMTHGADGDTATSGAAQRNETHVPTSAYAQFRISSSVPGAYTYGGVASPYNVPLLSMAGEFFTVNSPAADRCDNNGKGIIDDAGYVGRIDVKVAGWRTFADLSKNWNLPGEDRGFRTPSPSGMTLQFLSGSSADGKLYRVIANTSNTVTLNTPAQGAQGFNPGDRYAIYDYCVGSVMANNLTTTAGVCQLRDAAQPPPWARLNEPPSVRWPGGATLEILPNWGSANPMYGPTAARYGQRILRVTANDNNTGTLSMDGAWNYSHVTSIANKPVGYIAGRFDRPTPATHEDHVAGLININTAPRAVIESLVDFAAPASGGPDALGPAVSNAIWAKRTTGTPTYFVTAGEVNNEISTRVAAVTLQGNIDPKRGTDPNYRYASGWYRYNCDPWVGDPNKIDTRKTDDGLNLVDPATGVSLIVTDEPAKRTDVPYSWLANLITTRSDTFLVYIYVELHDTAGVKVPDSERRYMAMIDRGNVRYAVDNLNQLQPTPTNGQFELFVDVDTTTPGGPFVVASGLLQRAHTPNWVVDSFAGERVEILSGVAKGQVRAIRGNQVDVGLNDVLYVDSPWDGWQQWSTQPGYAPPTTVTVLGQTLTRYSISSDPPVTTPPTPGMTYHIGNRANITMFCEMD